MKPNAPIDVADFFKQQLHQQEIAPPEYIWNKIESEIPTYPIKPSWSWWMLNSAAIIIILSIGIYLGLQYYSSSDKPKGSIAYKHHTTNIHIKNTINTLENTPIVKQSEHSRPNTQTKIELPSQLQQTVYYIEANIAGKLNKIEILDSLNRIKKIINNPLPNDYGFYEMDIQQLKPGKYIIVLHRKDGSIIQRQEIFR